MGEVINLHNKTEGQPAPVGTLMVTVKRGDDILFHLNIDPTPGAPINVWPGDGHEHDVTQAALTLAIACLTRIHRV